MAFDTPPDFSKYSTQPKTDWPSQATSTLDELNTLMAANGEANRANLSTELANRLLAAKHQNEMANTYNNAINARTQTNATAQEDAWKKLQQASYVNHFDPKTFGPNMDSNPFFSRMPAVNEDERAGAKALQDTTRDSLMNGQYTNNGGAPLPAINPNPSAPIPEALMKPPKQGIWSKIGQGLKIAAPYVKLLAKV